MEIVNSLSLNMLPLDTAAEVPFTLRVEKVDVGDVVKLLRAAPDIRNLIGHPTTDVLVRNMLAPLGVNLPPGKREQVDWMRWIDGYPLLVAQYVGPRLPEGATILPIGARIIWFLADARSGAYHCTTCRDYTGRDDYASLLAREGVQLFTPT